MKLEIIKYYDHCTEFGDEWKDATETCLERLEPLTCVSVGWIIAENEKCLRLVPHFNGDPGEASECFGSYCILKAAIAERTVLRD